MPKITNDGLTRSGTGCFTAVSIWQQWASGRHTEQVKRTQSTVDARTTCHGHWYTSLGAGKLTQLTIQRLNVKGAYGETPITELRYVTRCIGLHNVTCHPTQVNALRLNPSQARWYTPKGWKAELI